MYRSWGFVPVIEKKEVKKDPRISYLPQIKWKPVSYKLDDETGEFVASGDKPKPFKVYEIKTRDYVQASAPLCDLKAIYARSVAANDPSLLIVREGVYGDFTDVPSNIHEADQMSLNQLSKFDESYEKLPENIKNVFGSKSEFVNAVLNDRIGDYIEQLTALSKVKENESEVK